MAYIRILRWAAYNEESAEDVNELAEQLADLGI